MPLNLSVRGYSTSKKKLVWSPDTLYPCFNVVQHTQWLHLYNGVCLTLCVCVCIYIYIFFLHLIFFLCVCSCVCVCLCLCVCVHLRCPGVRLPCWGGGAPGPGVRTRGQRVVGGQRGQHGLDGQRRRHGNGRDHRHPTDSPSGCQRPPGRAQRHLRLR